MEEVRELAGQTALPAAEVVQQDYSQLLREVQHLNKSSLLNINKISIQYVLWEK